MKNGLKRKMTNEELVEFWEDIQHSAIKHKNGSLIILPWQQNRYDNMLGIKR